MEVLRKIEKRKMRLHKHKQYKKLPRMFKEYYRAIGKLEFDEAPNYIYLKNIFVIFKRMAQAD